MKLAIIGVTVLFASGDYGDDAQNTECSCSKITVNFPASCPYVTAVGGTQIHETTETGITSQKEDAWSRGNCDSSSGGGFSNLFPLPDWQSTAVKTYFANHAPSYTAAQ